MQVVDRLAAVGAAVDHEPVAAGQAERARQLRGDDDEVPEHHGIVVAHVSERRDRPLGNHEHVHGGLRRHVVKREAEIVLVLDPGGDLPADDAAEDGVSHESGRPVSRPAAACGRGGVAASGLPIPS